MLVQLEFNGSPYLGVFARSNEDHVLCPRSLDDGVVEELADALEADPIVTSLGGGTILGALSVMNGHGVVVTDFAAEHELSAIEETGLAAETLPGRFNAAGNNVLANDDGALVNPDLDDDAVDCVEEVLGVPARAGTVAGLKTVGSAACVTSRGALCHPKTTDDELEAIEEHLDVRADIGTVNHGAPYIGAGMVGNADGAAIGVPTTGPELNRIEDALGYLD